ncbi:peroxiredoxin [Metallosphaera hakonensis]|uniref:thioredoxin-dependent peroxiredoxin n=1 Tax=Metallosphaera hakonensis JCM 8857 = DSM 7519 TaxID=1293036 RepID=A0A2U9IWE0_9CREN|nr:peroxiredoxin [Metallosphaera hakonensis]AWS00283.1 redoxin domain-containing protein [Metallosphaera hakonensis JCM 8857 = DSM 7519]
MKLKVGDEAPDFEGRTESGDVIRLSQFRGRYVVLYFYPKDDTPGCRAEALSFKENWDDIIKRGAVVLGVSGDSQESHKRFKEKYGLPFTLVSDEGDKIREMYGAKGFLIPGRVTFVIDPQGKIALIYSSQMNPTSHVREVLKVIPENLTNT